jgi:hypothetical protein
MYIFIMIGIVILWFVASVLITQCLSIAKKNEPKQRKML